MKIFKPIYYTSLLVIAVLFFIFSAIDFSGINARSYIDTTKAYALTQEILEDAPTRDMYLDTTNHEDAVDKITDVLSTDMELQQISTYQATDEDNVTTLGNISDTTYSVMEIELTAEEINDWYGELNIDQKYTASPNIKLTNIIVYIPAANEISGGEITQDKLTSDTIMYMTHYDSLSYTSSANNVALVGTMLESVREIKDYSNNKNSYLIVFADGGAYNALGAYAFREKFAGYNNVYSRVKAGISFDSLGANGALTLYESTNNASKLVSKWAQINKRAYASSVIDVAEGSLDRVFDYDIFSGIPALNFVNIADISSENMKIDNADNINKKLISQTGAIIVNTAQVLGLYDLDKLSNGTESVNFSYLGGIISYNNLASYILASILILLAGLVIVFNIKKKSFAFGNTVKGAGVQILALIITAVLNFGLYYAIGGLLAAMGYINIHALSSLAYSSIGLIIAFSIVSIAFSIGVYSILKKIFRISAADTIRGNIMLWVLAGIVLGYAVPKLAFAFIIMSILQLVVVLVMMFVSDSFKVKYHKDFERLLLFAVPLILTLPLIYGAIMSLSAILGAASYPLIMLIAVNAFGFLTPYFNYLVPVLDAVAKKLPSRNVRIEKTVVEKIEHKAKKGKFEERKIRKVVKEQRPRVYKNYFGISVIIIAGIIIMFVVSIVDFAVTNKNYGHNYSGTLYASEFETKNSLVYQKTSAGSYWVIDDLDMYRFVINDLEDYKWDAVLRAYKKDVSALPNNNLLSDVTRGDELTAMNNITASTNGNSKTFTVNFNNIYSNTRFSYDVELTNASTITKVTVKTYDNRGVNVTEEIEVNTANSTLILPNLKSISTITVEGKSNVYSGTVNINAIVNSYQNPNLITNFFGFSEWETVREIADKKGLDINIVLKIENSQTI